MGEKPIIFSTEMVKAILDGRKTQTRRVIKPQPPEGSFINGCPYTKSGWSLWGQKEELGIMPHSGCRCTNVSYPYGKPGDTLWVREAWCWTSERNYRYKDTLSERDNIIRGANGHKWKAPRYMPREASRIFLFVKSIRVERLQDITREDAVAEGITEYLSQFNPDLTEEAADVWRNRTTIENFAAVWNSINKKRGYPFEASPWVWVIEFEVRP